MNFLFLFMDGIGLGEDDSEINPFSFAKMPHLSKLLDGNKIVMGVAPLETDRATLLSLDASLGVEGRPQSASGQATLLTGKNVPKIIGEHFGPKPNQPIRNVIIEGSIFSILRDNNLSVSLLNAYPQGYFDGINSGKRLYSAIPQALHFADVKLNTTEDLYAGNALAADFTGDGWRKHLGYTDSPVMDESSAGKQLGKLTTDNDFAFFEYWPSDYAGHKQDKKAAIDLLESFDGVMGGLLDHWNDEEGLILITSDHGNMEDLSVRKHTMNQVPGLVIGSRELRKKFTQNMNNLTDIAPAILNLYGLGINDEN
ncbi:MAG: hypothetical protein HON98_10340 [Chloroflexi bacterium]|jgi:2,3-bisphosphoglycerate-independent phosphoglycerate mutase|nr:hypothetical protein [Chloroflexota bacterium]MBT3670940.1 hypothetical protein [Chloroflexota bacterium]MBT4001692.1 hypothetical protein [Chloroflexota bacterium]MBT4306346.1 hypothetical protein [Chloroflexota bacterium]MBT4532773.1 hypothetical protein [Chloroflexota bacterium]